MNKFLFATILVFLLSPVYTSAFTVDSYFNLISDLSQIQETLPKITNVPALNISKDSLPAEPSKIETKIDFSLKNPFRGLSSNFPLVASVSSAVTDSFSCAVSPLFSFFNISSSCPPAETSTSTVVSNENLPVTLPTIPKENIVKSLPPISTPKVEKAPVQQKALNNLPPSAVTFSVVGVTEAELNNKLSSLANILRNERRQQASSLASTIVNSVSSSSGSSSGGVNSVTNSDGSLTFSPTTGSVVGSLNLASSNVWSSIQTTFSNGVILGVSTTTSATTTNLAVTNLCLTGDVCRTSWPSGGSGGTDKFATSTNALSIYMNSATSMVLGGSATTTTGAKLEVLGGFYVNSSTTLQSLTFTNATGTNATTTGALSVGTNLTATGGLSTFSNTLHTGSTTLQALTFTTATGTNATTTGALSVGTNLTATGGLSTFSNVLLTGSTTLQAFTFTNATGTSATTTNFFTTTASSTNEFTGGLSFRVATGTAATTTNFFTNTLNVVTASTTNLLAIGSSTFQALTFTTATGTSATTTNFFTTTASSTNLFASFLTVGFSALSVNSTSGYIGAGTTTSQYLLQLASSSAPQLTLSDPSSLTNSHWSFRNAGGRLYIATSSPTTFATSSISAFLLDGNGSLSIANLISCGGIQTNANGLMSCTSDARLKDIQAPFTKGLSEILNIDPQTYSWKLGSPSYDHGVLYSGFIAQNVQGSIPEAVNQGAQGNLQVNQTTILAAVVNAIKELNTKVGVNASSTTESLLSLTSAIGLNLADASAGLDINNPVTLHHGLRVDNVSSLNDLLSFDSDINFIGRPYLNSDSGGIAVIHKGSRKVNVVFERSYIDTPVVSATLSLDGTLSSSQIDNIVLDKVTYMVIERSSSGFSILLSNPAPEDLSFSWIALAIKNMKVSDSSTTLQPGVPSAVIQISPTPAIPPVIPDTIIPSDSTATATQTDPVDPTPAVLDPVTP